MGLGRYEQAIGEPVSYNGSFAKDTFTLSLYGGMDISLLVMNDMKTSM